MCGSGFLPCLNSSSCSHYFARRMQPFLPEFHWRFVGLMKSCRGAQHTGEGCTGTSLSFNLVPHSSCTRPCRALGSRQPAALLLSLLPSASRPSPCPRGLLALTCDASNWALASPPAPSELRLPGCLCQAKTYRALEQKGLLFNEAGSILLRRKLWL